MSVEAAKIAASQTLDRCKALAREPFSTKDQRELAVQSAYELGVAEGRLAGMTEMGDELIASIKS